MKCYHLYLLGLMFLLSSFEENQDIISVNSCFSYYFYKCDYYYSAGKVNIAAVFPTKAREYNDLCSQNYLTAAKIYLATGVAEKLNPTLLIILSKGYNLNSLLDTEMQYSGIQYREPLSISKILNQK